MNKIINNDKIITMDSSYFDPDITFDCGQCFRWNKDEAGLWHGIVYNKSLTIEKLDDHLEISGVDQNTFDESFKSYFDLDRDYQKILEEFESDPILLDAITFAKGIRILKQDTWEALCSFIISQNNNIPRIKGIIDRLCENFGEKINESDYSFPTAERIAELTVEDLAPLRSGFRAKYIIDAAKKVSSGIVDVTSLESLPLDEARESLMQICGVGPKVADCALLFGSGRLDAFPIDVWIKRILAKFYPDGFPEKFREYGGIAQQFLFHYARCCESVAKSFKDN